MIDLLDLTCPMKESPNVIYALHLIELMARDSPVFIAHHKHETNTTVGGSFEDILAFYQYEQNNWGLVTVNAFTAISPPKLMHEDICTMALDKQTSFIILPFHRKWSVNGSVEAENNVVRNVNCSVLDQSPCSVGILIDRGGRRIPMKSSSYSVGILFLDRRDVLDWDTIMDIEILKDVKQNNGILGNGCDMMYVEQVSDSGSQTAKIIRTVADDYDLIIVGRRYGVESIQSMGLSE
ncbi:hypothetical protein GOBAR_AA23786 [Gossypium barbadense]|uniref:Cation/H(+) antiporter central domain-containing protein n=1 Tax=Gossypium barbadense TaxID=3634 RepID=A0A2P5X0T4_GOSBA|nr:hypothetical protein GOBAR_AA23786 [Gossypium barbadense]